MTAVLGPRKLGPLTPLVGEWEGDVGIDLSFHNLDDETSETGYFEHASFKPVPIVTNGQQNMHGLNYSMTAWRHGEEAMDPFHDETGYLLWDQTNGQVMRCFAVPRGLAILAGSDAGPRDRTLNFVATPGAADYGLCQNKYLMERARVLSFESVFTLDDEVTFSYTSDLFLKLAETGTEMHHTDRNTLHRVKRYHPSVEID